MTAAFLRIDVSPRLPARSRAIAVMSLLGVFTGLLSSLPSPLPDLRLSDPEIVINARHIPLHAGIAFGAMLASMIWVWNNRDAGKCLLGFAFVLLGWLAAVNTANEVTSSVMQSALFGTSEGAKEHREMLGWLLGGVAAGGVGAGLVAFGLGIAAEPLRHLQGWMPVVAIGTVLGLLLYPAGRLDTLSMLFIPWQAAVAASIAYALTLPKT